MRAALSMALAAAGCTFSRPADVPDPDAPIEVDATDGCIANPGVCDGTDTNCVDDRCVDCPLGEDRQHAACTETTAPICGADLDCRPCRVHEECDSGVCAPDGTCASGVLYVRTDGNDASGTNDCTRRDNPCLTLTRAVSLVPPTAGNPMANRRFIRLVNGEYYLEPGAVTIDAKTIEIVGPPPTEQRAVIDRSGTGPTLVIQNGANVRVERLAAINAASGTLVDGIVCSSSTLVAVGIQVEHNGGTGIISDFCDLTLLNSVLYDNLDGGISAAGGRVVLVNNTIVENGPGASFGAVGLQSTVSAASIFQSNTIVRNRTLSPSDPDVGCDVNGMVARNNIIYGRGLSARVSGICTYEHTLYGPDDPGSRLGSLNGNFLVADELALRFVANAARDYHLQATSIAKDKGTAVGLAPEAMVDIDGEPRPQGLADVGADEIP